MSKQYRPVFSASQILRIKEVFSELSQSYEDMKLFQYLCKFTRDIETGYKTPSYELSKPTLEQSLGVEAVESNPTAGMDNLQKQEYWFSQYKEGKYVPKNQMYNVHQYRYINDLMSAEEEQAFGEDPNQERFN